MNSINENIQKVEDAIKLGANNYMIGGGSFYRGSVYTNILFKKGTNEISRATLEFPNTADRGRFIESHLKKRFKNLRSAPYEDPDKKMAPTKNNKKIEDVLKFGYTEFGGSLKPNKQKNANGYYIAVTFYGKNENGTELQKEQKMFTFFTEAEAKAFTQKIKDNFIQHKNYKQELRDLKEQGYTEFGGSLKPHKQKGVNSFRVQVNFYGKAVDTDHKFFSFPKESEAAEFAQTIKDNFTKKMAPGKKIAITKVIAALSEHAKQNGVA